MMTDAEIEEYRGRLKALKDHLEGAGQVTIEPNCTDAAGRRDEDFQPLNEMYQAIASGRNKNRGRVIKQIKAALELIERYPDEYGLCQECEEPIPRGRQLDALCAPLRALSIRTRRAHQWPYKKKSNRLPLTRIQDPPHMRFGPGVQV